MCSWNIAGQEVVPTTFAKSRQTWLRLSRMSLWPPEAPQLRLCDSQLVRYLSYLRPSGDPVGGGFVESLARPGGNITGFAIFEYAIGAKWLELLREISPRTTRVAVLRDPAVATGPGQFAAIQTAAPSFGMEIIPVNMRDASEIDRAVTAFAQSSNGGLIVSGTPLAQIHRDLIIKLAARYKLPAVYFERFFVAGGGLISYGTDFVDQYRRVGGYVHRILNGEKPADLPVQAPTKYELVINLKTAKALGLTVSPSLLTRADGVIE